MAESIYRKASLAMIPYGAKEDELPSIKPTDGSGDFTFSRGSDIQATRVNSSGLIEKAKENLLTYSNDFSNAAWTKTAVSITSGQADPFGGSNASKIVEDTSTNFHRINGGYTMVSGNIYATSVYAKASGRNYLTMSNNVSAGTCVFDLTDGSIAVQESSVVAAKTTDVGGGWYRCEMVAVGDKSGSYNVFIGADDDGTIGTYLGDGTSGVLIYQSQLNHGLIAQDYVETTTTAVVEGLTADLPRLDYSGGASCPSLLLEPSRTNSIPQAEYLDSWGSTNVLVTSNDVTSPEGVVNASKLERNTTGAYISQNVSLSGDQTYSVFLKKGDLNFARVLCLGGSTPNVYFDLQNGSVETENNATGSIEDYGNGWYRCSVVSDNSTTAVRVYPTETDGSTGGALGYIYAYGAQLESGSYPTSYIPTYGTAAQRNRDLSYATSQLNQIGQTEGTIFVEFQIPEGVLTDAEHRFSFSDNTTNNWIFISINNGNDSRVYYRAGSSTLIDYAPSDNRFVAGNTYKMAFAYSDGSSAYYVDGVQVQSFSETLTAPTSELDVFTLTGDNPTTPNNAQNFSNTIKQVAIFKTRLTNAELAALTA
jgi:hypothetical protein